MIAPFPSPLDGCRLWCVDLDAPLPAGLLATLSASERVRAARFVFEHDRRRYQAAHAALRQLIAQELAEGDPSRIAFVEGDHGKPALAGMPALHFNLSHSGRFGVVAFAARPVGVDVEALRPMPDADTLAAAHFTANEGRALRAHAPGPDRDLAFLQGWTRKEACLKAIGAGLTLDTREVEVGIGTGRQEVAFASGATGLHRLRLASAVPDGEAVVAVALVQPVSMSGGVRSAPSLETCA